MIEEWHGAYPERFIPMQLPWFTDPVLAGEEVRRNAERGFTSVPFLESPHLLRLPPITDIKHWEPFFKACEETRTVISMHCGASGFVLQGSPGGGLNVQTSLFPAGAFCAAVDWVWAGIPALYPDLKIALSEGGIRWVPMATNRLDYVLEHSGSSACWMTRRPSTSGTCRRQRRSPLPPAAPARSALARHPRRPRRGSRLFQAGLSALPALLATLMA